MRERPSFDDFVEPPARVLPPLDGETDEQWAERVRRSERNFRFGFGLVFGFLVGAATVLHWFAGLQTPWPALMVVSGCMLLFAALFARRRDNEALAYAGWLALPEWMFAESLPWWAIAVIWFTGAAILAVAIAVAMQRYF
jgi:hypothetical protein